MTNTYYAPTGGHPDQTQLLTDRAVFTEAYAVIPKGTMRDIVTSFLPFWERARFWVIARPMTGFAETFSHYIAEVAPGGGSPRPELDPEAEAVIFVVEGGIALTIDGTDHNMEEGGYAYLPAGCNWTLKISEVKPRGSTGSARPIRRWRACPRPRPLSPMKKRLNPPGCPAPMNIGAPRALSNRMICAMTCM